MMHGMAAVRIIANPGACPAGYAIIIRMSVTTSTILAIATPYDWGVYMDFADKHGWRD